jgi:hypothetical protein
MIRSRRKLTLKDNLALKTTPFRTTTNSHQEANGHDGSGSGTIAEINSKNSRDHTQHSGTRNQSNSTIMPNPTRW